MNNLELIEKLNSLQRWEFEDTSDLYQVRHSMLPNKYGDYVKIEDVAALFNLIADTYSSENCVREKVLPNS